MESTSIWMTKSAVQRFLAIGPYALDMLVADRKITIRQVGCSPVKYLRADVERIDKEAVKPAFFPKQGSNP